MSEHDLRAAGTIAWDTDEFLSALAAYGTLVGLTENELEEYLWEQYRSPEHRADIGLEQASAPAAVRRWFYDRYSHHSELLAALHYTRFLAIILFFSKHGTQLNDWGWLQEPALTAHMVQALLMFPIDLMGALEAEQLPTPPAPDTLSAFIEGLQDDEEEDILPPIDAETLALAIAELAAYRAAGRPYPIPPNVRKLLPKDFQAVIGQFKPEQTHMAFWFAENGHSIRTAEYFVRVSDFLDDHIDDLVRDDLATFISTERIILADSLLAALASLPEREHDSARAIDYDHVMAFHQMLEDAEDFETEEGEPSLTDPTRFTPDDLAYFLEEVYDWRSMAAADRRDTDEDVLQDHEEYCPVRSLRSAEERYIASLVLHTEDFDEEEAAQRAQRLREICRYLDGSSEDLLAQGLITTDDEGTCLSPRLIIALAATDGAVSADSVETALNEYETLATRWRRTPRR